VRAELGLPMSIGVGSDQLLVTVFVVARVDILQGFGDLPQIVAGVHLMCCRKASQGFVPDLSTDLTQCIRDARTRIPAIVAEVEDVVRAVDPIELLSQLSMLYLTHPIDTMPNRDEKPEWQVRIEWLAWLIFTRRMKAPALPVLIDAQVLAPLEALLEEYVRAVAITLMEPVEGLTASQNSLRASLQTEALFVRDRFPNAVGEPGGRTLLSPFGMVPGKRRAYRARCVRFQPSHAAQRAPRVTRDTSRTCSPAPSGAHGS
jgi:hypothetical protein